MRRRCQWAVKLPQARESEESQGLEPCALSTLVWLGLRFDFEHSFSCCLWFSALSSPSLRYQVFKKRRRIAGLPIDGSIQKIDLFIYVFFLKNITFIKIIRKAYYSIMYVPLLSWLSDLGQAALCHISFLNYRMGLIKPLRDVVRLSEMTYVKRHSARQIVAAILFLPRPRRNLFNMSKRTQI